MICIEDDSSVDESVALAGPDGDWSRPDPFVFDVERWMESELETDNRVREIVELEGGACLSEWLLSTDCPEQTYCTGAMQPESEAVAFNEVPLQGWTTWQESIARLQGLNGDLARPIELSDWVDAGGLAR
jgi:hypothetical protein